MPQLGVNDDVAVVAEWLVEEGDAVQSGARIAVIETMKASVDLKAPSAGFVYPLVARGAEVPVQTVIALVLEQPDREEFTRRAAELRQGGSAAGGVGGVGSEGGGVATGAGASPPDGLRITRRARDLVEEMGVDVATLPTDRIVREADVLALAGAPAPAQTPSSPDRRVAVYGASQGGAALAETIVAMGGYEVVAFLDDTEALIGAESFGLPVWPGVDLPSLAGRGVGAVATHIAIRPFRLALRDRIEQAGLTMINAVHPRAHLSPSARLGVGTVIKAGAVVDAEVRIGDCCIVDNGAVVAHHNRLGQGVHLAPGVSMGGDCRVGDQTLVGVGAAIGARVTIGSNVIVAPGAVVVSDVPDDVVVEGSPATVVGRRR